MEKRDVSSWFSKPTCKPEKQLIGHGLALPSDREKLAARSAKVYNLLKENPQVKLSTFFQDMPTDKEIFELVGRFCRGFEVNFTSENVIPLICLANYLEMIESHSSNNLLDQVVAFFEERVLSSWDETVKALRSAGHALQEAARVGLFEACVESLVEKAQADPSLLGDPVTNSMSDEETEYVQEEECRRNARRRLFAVDWKPEDLTELPIQVYQPIVHAMSQRQVQQEYVAASVCQYAEKWILCSGGGENVSIYKRNSQRDVIEALESLLPDEQGLIPCTLLFRMLRFAIFLEASTDCTTGFENRIGRQLEQATVKDLFLLSQGYAKEMQYNIECLSRIVNHFYSNYSSSTMSGLIAVAELIEEFLLEVSSDIDLKMETFAALGEISIAALFATDKNANGIYRAIDIYLDKHRYLTENEREEVCRILDCNKMSSEACEHAVSNGRLPLRFVVQILFASNLQMRSAIANQVHFLDEKLRSVEMREKESEVKLEGVDDEEEVRSAMEKMSIKMMELEKECCTMRKKIQSDCSNYKLNKGKTSMWKEMKRKLGCLSSSHDSNCQVKKKKKVHPKY